VADVETMARLFWQVRGEKLTDKQVERILAFWEHCLTWQKQQTGAPERLLASLARLSPFVEKLDDRTQALLMAVVPYAHVDHSTDQMIEALLRLVESNPAGVAALLGRMLDANAPNYDMNDKLKALIEKFAALGLRGEAIRCTEKVRRSLPGMLDLYKKLVAAN
jgi:hypothetical protein